MRTNFYNGIGIPDRSSSPTFISEKGKRTYYFFDEKSLPQIKSLVKTIPLIGYPNNFIVGNDKKGEVVFFWDEQSLLYSDKKDRVSNLNKAHTITIGLGNGFEEVYIKRKISGL